MTTNIDKCLTEINIYELINQIGVPFNHISDVEIEDCIAKQLFLEPHCIYNVNTFHYHTKTYHLFRIATTVNEIQNNRYNYNYHIPIWDYSDDDAHHEWDINREGEHQIRAFYYCKKNIYMLVNK